MRAKAKLILVAMLLSSSPSNAEPQRDICAQLASSDPDYVLNQLRTFSPNVMGKPAITWSRDDLVNLSKNIFACEGLPKGPSNAPKVSPTRWVNQLNAAGNVVLPINDLNRAVQHAYKPLWKWSDIPSCQSILSWKRDQVWNENNSEELFGKNFRELSPAEATIAKGFTNECVAVAKKILELNRMDMGAAEKIADDIERTIEKEQEASQEKKNGLAPSLRIYRAGRRIPLAYLGPQSRKWVEFVNKFESQDLPMRVEDMVTVSKWTEMVLSSKKENPESAFAEAVRAVISKRMFSQK